MTTFALAHSIDILRGAMGTREAHASLRGIGEARKMIETGEKIGQNKNIADPIDEPLEGKEEFLRRREKELTAELEAIREQRGA
jgi:hypothetical protein